MKSLAPPQDIQPLLTNASYNVCHIAKDWNAINKAVKFFSSSIGDTARGVTVLNSAAIAVCPKSW